METKGMWIKPFCMLDWDLGASESTLKGAHQIPDERYIWLSLSWKIAGGQPQVLPPVSILLAPQAEQRDRQSGVVTDW